MDELDLNYVQLVSQPIKCDKMYNWYHRHCDVLVNNLMFLCLGKLKYNLIVIDII